MSNIRPGGKFDIEYNARYLPDSFAQDFEKYLLADDDVVIAMTDLADYPKILGVPTVVKTGGRNLLLNQRVGKLVTKDTKRVHFPYLQLALNFGEVRAIYKRFAGGGLQINLGKADLLSVKIPLPPLAEQKRIAGILDAADKLRAKRRESIAQLDTLLQSTFLDMFGDPVTNSRYKVSSLGDNLEFVTSGGRGWAKYYSAEGSRFIRSLDVQMNSIGDDDVVYVDPPNNAEAKRTKVKKDDVLLTITGSRIGRVARAPANIDGAYISQHVSILRVCQSNFLPEYVSRFLSLKGGGQRQISKLQYGQTKPGLNFKQIRSFQIPVPPLQEQIAFVESVKVVDDLWVKLQCHLQDLNSLFSSLQQRAFNGTL